MSTPAPTTPPAADKSAAATVGLAGSGLDPLKLAESLAAAAEKSAKLISDFAARNAGKQAAVASDELGLGKAFMELAAKMLTNPVRLAEGQMNLPPAAAGTRRPEKRCRPAVRRRWRELPSECPRGRNGFFRS